MTAVRALTIEGIKQFQDFLGAGARGLPPVGLSENPALSTEIDPPAEVEPRTFESRLDLGRYLLTQMTQHNPAVIANQAGLWSWLAVFYFDQLCPVRANGNRRPGGSYRYVLAKDSFRHYYRHLIAVPFRLVHLHGDNARCLLAPPVHRHGDFVEQLAARQEIITNRELIRAVDLLYFDTSLGRPKRGATDREQPGTLRRFIALFQQLDLTYDLQGLPAHQFIELLPQEFDSWK